MPTSSSAIDSRKGDVAGQGSNDELLGARRTSSSSSATTTSGRDLKEADMNNGNGRRARGALALNAKTGAAMKEIHPWTRSVVVGALASMC
jgi:hypothetical protein